MEELRQREANLTALRAIGPRKKPRLDIGVSVNSPGSNSGLNASATGINRQMPMKPRLKKVNFRDLLFLLEQEKETCRSTMLYKSYLKWCSIKGRNLSDPPDIWRSIYMVLCELASMDLDESCDVSVRCIVQCFISYIQWNSLRITSGFHIHPR